jgi:hypothetical protein
LLASFALPAGPAAALLALPWLLATVLLALLGLLRLLERGPLPITSLALDAGFAFIAVGGVWTAASRAGWSFLGFGEPTVLLTGAHFHFAGFVLPLLTGLASKALPGRLGSMAACGVVAGVPLVALGITLTPRGFPLVELLATIWMAAACAATAALQIRLGVGRPRSLEAGALVLGGVSLLGAMMLALAYSAGSYLGIRTLDIPSMIFFHATLNVFGFALPGLLFWNAALGRPGEHVRVAGEERPGVEVLFPWLGDTFRLEDWEGRGFSHGVEAGSQSAWRRDNHELLLGVEPPGPPLADGLHRRAAPAIVGYEVFPPELLAPVKRRERLLEGDTAAGRYRLLPGVEVAVGARVIDCFDGLDGGRWRTGFTYRTLQGHPLMGEETFSVEKCLQSGEVRVALRSWSKPASFASRLLYPLVRALQVSAARAGLRRLAELARR